MRVVCIIILIHFSCLAYTQQAAPKPLYRDPVYDGAADPVVIWNPAIKKWWMFYTNRRATMPDSSGVKWVHGTRIGIAESDDGIHWKYKDTANINYRPDAGYTFWAPDIIEHNGTWHMYLTYVPGIFADWNHPRNIVHCTSKDLLNWQYESTLSLVNDKVIDASVYRLPDGNWRLWYNNEKDGKSIWYADSKDLYHWEDKGKAIAARGEGPKVFRWKDQYWMVVDVWKGMDIYNSADLLQWKKQNTRILEEPGTGAEDQAIGGHADVVVNDDKVYLYYFTHPGRRKDKPAPRGSVDDKRTLIQLAMLEYKDGELTCDRNKPVYDKLKPKKKGR
ncbi:family 43 glycosylhydrolase [Pseudoflavitalea sp. X16]|uniref:family 43 glycosylhydrolase n=1 Tax=Paraflavitalea devenefica TaxID=2716334 RepID=UPI0014242EA4|nr:family 43 glycosylhydrolase [Paraflavitalea devenefica]NII25267.1 family 43 glycosylhydrolase [Paraflavitalea devenefica]